MKQETEQKIYVKKKFTEEDFTLNAQMEAEGIRKVLAVKVMPSVKNHELVSGELSVDAKALLSVTYEAEKGIVKTINGMTDFNPRIKADTNNKIFVSIETVKCSAGTLGSKDVTINASLKCEVYELACESITVFTPDTPDVFVTREKKEIRALTAMAEETFSAVLEFEIGAGDVIASDSAIITKKAKALTDMIVVEGEIIFNLFQKSGDLHKSITRKIEFNQEVAALGAKAGQEVDAQTLLTSVSSSVSNNGDQSIATISAGIKVEALIFEKREIEIITDIFSDKNELLVSIEGFENQKVVSNEIRDTVETITLSSKEKSINIGEVIGVINVTNKEERTIEATVLHQDPETKEINSCLLVGILPDSLNEKEIKILSIIPRTINRRKAKEVEAEMMISFEKVLFSKEYEQYIANIEPRGEIAADSSAITVYSGTKGQTLFQLAKALRVSPEVLKAQNPDLDDVLSCDRRIVLYKQI